MIYVIMYVYVYVCVNIYIWVYHGLSVKDYTTEKRNSASTETIAGSVRPRPRLSAFEGPAGDSELQHLTNRGIVSRGRKNVQLLRKNININMFLSSRV